MNKSIKRTMGLILAFVVAVSVCVDMTGVFADEAKANEQNEKVEVKEVQETQEAQDESKDEAEKSVESKAVKEAKTSEDKLEISEETSAQNNAVGGDADKAYIEILPEISVKEDEQGNSQIFTSSEDTIGVRRNINVFGSFNKRAAEIEKAWLEVYFNVYDEKGNLVERTKGTSKKGEGKMYWGGAKYLGPYDKGHNYTVRVDLSTIPTGYHSWLTATETGRKIDRNTLRPEDVMEVENFQVAKYKKDFTNDIAVTRFHMDTISFSFVRNEEVGKDQFSLKDNGEVTKRNPNWKNGEDYVVKQITSDGRLVAPSAEEMDQLADEGYRPNGFYAYSVRDDGTEVKSPGLDDYIINYNGNISGYGYLRSWNDNHGINTRNKFNYSSVYTIVLDQSIPEVTFDWNENGKDNPQNRTVLNVYYNKSLKNNSVSKDDKGLPKTLPKEPTPTKEGKVFAGWNTKQDGTGETFTEDTIVTDDIKVYAQWKDKEYTITVDPNGGNWNGDTAIKTQQFKENEEFKLPEAPTKDGYTFLYWKGSEYKPGQVYVVKEDHKFTAQWKKNEVKPEPKKTEKIKKTPKTGDSSEMMMYAGIAALMSMGALLILKKKRSYK